MSAGQTPFDKGNGEYKVFFVNHKDPTNHKDASVTIAHDLFELQLDYGDYPPRR